MGCWEALEVPWRGGCPAPCEGRDESPVTGSGNEDGRGEPQSSSNIATTRVPSSRFA